MPKIEPEKSGPIFCQKHSPSKKGNFCPKSKAIGLHFCPKLNLKKVGQFFPQNIHHQKWANFGQKARLRLTFLPRIEPEKSGPIFCQKNSPSKMGNFCPKSKAIGLHFCPNLNRTKVGQFFVKKIHHQKLAIFVQKVRL